MRYIVIALSRTFELIGRFAKDYPDCIENEDGDGVKIRDMYFKALEKAVINQQDVISLLCIFIFIFTLKSKNQSI